MQMVLSPIQWGNATLVLDQRAFDEGYTLMDDSTILKMLAKKRKETG